MTNKEKFAEQILEVACRGGYGFAVNKETKSIGLCIMDIKCNDCLFAGGERSCVCNCREWCNAEYVEPKITIPKDTPVDAKVLVSADGRYWLKRHFAKIEDGKVCVWNNGGTSWTAPNSELAKWKYGKLAEDEE